MPDFTALVTPPKLVGPDMKPANGDIYVRSTNNVPKSGVIVIPFQAHGKIVNGEFKALDGGPLMLVVTPEGVALEIFADIVQEGPTGRRDKFSINRTVSVPNQSTVTWDALVDVVPVGGGTDYEVPTWVTNLLAEAVAAGPIATNAATLALEALEEIDQKVAGVPTSAQIAASIESSVAATSVRKDVAVSGNPSPARGIPSDIRATLPSRDIFVRDSAHEWWSTPIATKIDRTTYSGGYSSKGEVIAWDEHDRDGLTTAVVGDAGSSGPIGDVDDHDSPARWISDDAGFSVIIHNNHGDTDYLSIRVSLNGTARGFTAQPEVRLVVSPGAQISYNPFFLHSVSGNVYTFWVLVRTGTGWAIKVFTANRETGAITGGALYRIGAIGALQPYFMPVKQGRVLRIAAYVNPAYNTHAIWLLHVNMDTLTMTNPMDGAMSHAINGGSYFDLTGTTPLVPETATTNTSRRMYYPSPTADRVIFSEWTRGAESAAVYMEASLSGSTVSFRTLGPAAGKRNGYTAAANYNPGAAYSPDGSKIATLHNTTEGGEVWIHTAARSWLTRRTTYNLSRPTFITENELMWLAVDHYDDYFQFLLHQVSQVGFPEISGSITVSHPLRTAGTMWLVDPTFTVGWGAGVPATVPNLADYSDASLTHTIGSGGVVERTAKGGLHVAAAKAATGNQSLVIGQQTARDSIVAAIGAGHKLFIAEVYRVTRNPDAGFAPTTATARYGGIISTTSADIATIRTGTTQAVRGYPTAGVVNERAGTALAATGVQVAMAEITPGAGTANASTSLTVHHNAGAGSPVQARITYLALVEDLNASGRTYAQAAAAVDAFMADVFGTGGRYSGDTWTTP